MTPNEGQKTDEAAMLATSIAEVTASVQLPDSPDRRTSIDTALRNLQQQLVAVTGQADLKASIVITASSISLSLAASRINDGRLRPGVLTLGLFVLAALCCAIFAVLPKYQVNGEPPVGQFNPLFFGHVALLSRESYEAEMHRILRDEELMYSTILADLHAQSTYLLHRKFRPLRWAYMCLLVGFPLAGVVQVIAELRR
ncbi:MAG: Pycsar system effector family protein [Ilumatobacteraceae bacterium]